MAALSEADLIYDWNARARPRASAARVPVVRLYDETLRDGLQGPSVVDPSLGAKKRIVELADALGIHFVNIGLPGAGPRAVEHALGLARHIGERRLAIRPSCAARTRREDIRPVVEISQATGMAIEVMAFLGCSPIRQYVEDWSLERLLALGGEAIRFAASEGLPVTFVIEDATRSRPETLDALLARAIDCGASRVCLCDTVGHATPEGTQELVRFTRSVLERRGTTVGIDWHGHNDRGLALANALRAADAGADRIHGTALGIGERVGNAPLDLLLVNLRLRGVLDLDLSALPAWCTAVSEAVGWPIPRNYPVLGSDAFRTATGVHAAAVVKAQRKGDRWLADRIYSGVPADLLGREQRIEVGPMSGLSNVRHWLGERGYPDSPVLCRAILEAAKRSDHVLGDDELEAIVQRHRDDRWDP